MPRTGPRLPVTLTLPRFTRIFMPPGRAIVFWREGRARLRVVVVLVVVRVTVVVRVVRRFRVAIKPPEDGVNRVYGKRKNARHLWAGRSWYLVGLLRPLDGGSGWLVLATLHFEQGLDRETEVCAFAEGAAVGHLQGCAGRLPPVIAKAAPCADLDVVEVHPDRAGTEGRFDVDPPITSPSCGGRRVASYKKNAQPA